MTSGPVFRRILIANRGEIALRVIRTAREMGIECVAVYSDVDRKALHTRMAHVAVALGGSKPAESYLDADKVLDAARLVQNTRKKGVLKGIRRNQRGLDGKLI